MKLSTKALTLLLASAMLAPAAVSCGDTTEEKPASTTAAKETEAVTETADPHLDSLPDDIDLGGKTIRVLGRMEPHAANEILVEGQNGEVINDAVYTRNVNLEKRLNIKLEAEIINGGGDQDAVTLLQNAVNSGDMQYDVFCNNSYRTAEAGYNGLLADLTALDNLDLTKEYWSQGLNETASAAHKQFVCTGPMSLGFFRYIMVTVFNKKMFTQNDIEFPYKTVLDGKWTLDAMSSIAKDLYADLNGNNERDRDDQYGYVTRMAADTSINDGFWSSLDLHTTAKDADDLYTYAVDTESFSTAVDNLFTLMKGNGTDNMCDNDGDIYKRFYNGLAAMSNARLYMVESDEFRNMEDEYGILPMPKRDESQKNYYSLAQDQFLVYAVPVHLSDAQKQDAGTFLEAYASESYLTVKPAYYEIALTTKYVNDAESAAMLDIITSGLYTDPSVLYLTVFSFNVMTLRNMLGSGTNTMSSKIEAVRKSMENNLDKLNTAFSGMEG